MKRLEALLEWGGTKRDIVFLSLSAAALAAPWHKAELLGGVQMQDLELTHQVTAVIQRSYHADG